MEHNKYTAEPEPGLSRRKFLRLAAGAAVTAVAGAGVVLGEGTAHANPQESSQPPKPLTPEEREALEDEKLKAEIRQLDAETDLQKLELQKARKELNPPLSQKIGKIASDWGNVAAAAVTGVIASVGGAKYFRDRKEQRQSDENNNFEATSNRINDMLTANVIPPQAISEYYKILHRYLGKGLERFTSNIIDKATAYLRARAKWIETKLLNPEQIEGRVNHERTIFKLLVAAVAEHNKEQSKERPNLRGISLEGMRQLEEDDNLIGVDLTGAHLRGLTFRNSLAGSDLSHARLGGSQFGEQGNPCDLRGTNLALAEFGSYEYTDGRSPSGNKISLPPTHFACVIIGPDTEFNIGGGENPKNPRVTFGTVTSSDGMTKAEIQAKIDEVKKAIEAWDRDHPEETTPNKKPWRKRLGKAARALRG